MVVSAGERAAGGGRLTVCSPWWLVSCLSDSPGAQSGQLPFSLCLENPSERESARARD